MCLHKYLMLPGTMETPVNDLLFFDPYTSHQQRITVDLLTYAEHPDAKVVSPHEYACRSFDYDFCRLTIGYDPAARVWVTRCADVGAFVHRRSKRPATVHQEGREQKYQNRGYEFH